MRSRRTRITISCLVVAAAATGLAPAAANGLAPTTRPVAAPVAHGTAVRTASLSTAGARLTALEAQADRAGVAAQRADEAVLQHPSARTRAEAARAQAALKTLAARQTPELQRLAAALGSAATQPQSTGTTAELTAWSGRTNALKAVSYARRHLGDSYGFAKAGPHAFDCSGLTMESYSAEHVQIGGHGATAQWRRMSSHHRLVPWSKRLRGDLIFYGTPGSVYHVAIYAGGNKMIEAPYPGKKVREVAVRSGSRLAQVGRPTGSSH